MSEISEVRVGVQPFGRFAAVLTREEMNRAVATAKRLSERYSKRVIWNVNSTAVGGGVAEMLPSLLAYTRSFGIDSRWLVISGDHDFFRITKRLHHALHGSEGDGSPLDEEAHVLYERTLARNALELADLVREGDAVLLHDPQTVGMAPALRRCGVDLIWRCHIGSDTINEQVELGWSFLSRYLRDVSVYVFSRESYVPSVCDRDKSRIITPSIDVFSAKNQQLSEDAIHTILVHTGLVEGPPPERPDHGFIRDDGTPGRVGRHAEIIRAGRAPAWDAPLVVQVSRWDPLKDMAGVMQGFALLCERGGAGDAHLLLAGPDVRKVADDPEGSSVFGSVNESWHALNPAVRDRVHLTCLPVADVQENAAIVNALQRHAAVVVQKSLREGFGLTVTEAMWKERAVVASGVGGINDQIEDGVSGVLLEDPTDLDRFASVLGDLLASPSRRHALGQAARQRVRDHFLGVDHLLKYADLLEGLDGGADI